MTTAPLGSGRPRFDPHGLLFALHAGLAFLALTVLNWLVVAVVPFQIKFIGDSYLIFFYHFPAAINVFVFYFALCVFSITYLATKDPVWDRHARAAAQVGLLANAILLVTGSIWAKAAWGVWWVWDDPRLMSAAVMSLIYAGYPVLQRSVEEPDKRRTFAAVYGIAASVNVPIVHYAIKLFGQVSHPKELSGLSDADIIATRWYGVGAFLVLYTLIYRWRHDREVVAERVEDALLRVRRAEEALRP